MMLDDLHTPGDGGGEGARAPGKAGVSGSGELSAPGGVRGGARGEPGPAREREVPLPGHLSPSVLHQWLDGDAPVSVVRAAAGGDDTVDLWTRINDEAELLRSRTTPLHVHKRIMDSLPSDAHRLRRPWYRRPVPLSPVGLLGAAAVLLALGALVARVAVQ